LSTFRLYLSAFCGIGSACRCCLGAFHTELGVIRGCSGCTFCQKRLRLSSKVDECKRLAGGGGVCTRDEPPAAGNLRAPLRRHHRGRAGRRRHARAPPRQGPAAARRPAAAARGEAVQVDPTMPTLKAPGLMHFELGYDGPNSHFAFKFNVRPYTAAAAASPAAPAPAVLTNPVQSGFSFWKKPASFQYALAPKHTKVHPDVLPGKSGKAGKVGK